MVGSTYAASPQKEDCSIRRASMLCRLRIDGKHLRLAQRGGIEVTNSLLNRVTEIGRLGVRAFPSATPWSRQS